jgi:hypothetical protein
MVSLVLALMLSGWNLFGDGLYIYGAGFVYVSDWLCRRLGFVPVGEQFQARTVVGEIACFTSTCAFDQRGTSALPYARLLVERNIGQAIKYHRVTV